MNRHALSVVALSALVCLSLGCRKTRSSDHNPSSSTGAQAATGGPEIVGWDALESADPATAIGSVASLQGHAQSKPMTVTGSPKVMVNIEACPGVHHKYIYAHSTNRAAVDRLPYKDGCVPVRVRLDSHDKAGWHTTILD